MEMAVQIALALMLSTAFAMFMGLSVRNARSRTHERIRDAVVIEFNSLAVSSYQDIVAADTTRYPIDYQHDLVAA